MEINLAKEHDITFKKAHFEDNGENIGTLLPINDLLNNNANSSNDSSENLLGELILDKKQQNDDPSMTGPDLKISELCLEVNFTKNDKNCFSEDAKEKIDTESSVKEKICVVCKKSKICNYSITDKRDKRYLCEDRCFEDFKMMPFAYLTTNINDLHQEQMKSHESSEMRKSCITCGKLLIERCNTFQGSEFRNFCSGICHTQYLKFYKKDGQTEHSEIAATNVVKKCTVCGATAKDINCSLRHGDSNYSFCSLTCINTFKAKKDRLGECVWCHIKKPIFDMLDEPEPSTSIRKWCSLICFSLHMTKEQSSSSTSLCCFNCQKSQTAHYYMKMSDLSIKSFCCFPCVRTFYSKFSRNPSKVRSSISTPNIQEQLSVEQSNTETSKQANSEETKQFQTILKQLKNKSILCKPIHSKIHSCILHLNDKETQTDDSNSKIEGSMPVMVPVVCSQMGQSSMPAAIPTVIPVLVPVPCFVLKRKSSVKITEEIENIPSEADLLAMAEQVDITSENKEHNENAHKQSRTFNVCENGEDMLQIALRMANEMTKDDQVTDLESGFSANQTNESITRNDIGIDNKRDYENAENNVDILKETNNIVKRHRIEGQVVDFVKEPNQNPKVPEFSTDYNFALKFSYGINAYKHWVLSKNAEIESKFKKSQLLISPLTKCPRLFKLDILQASSDELNHALTYFVKEIRKPNGEDYVSDSILYLCLGIQAYLHMFGRVDNIFTDSSYDKFSNALNDILLNYEVRLDAQGFLVSRIEEEHLWECKQLGAHSPHVLINTLVYFNAKHFLLRSPKQHINLSFSHIIRQYKKVNNQPNKPGKSVFLRYCAPSLPGVSEYQKKRRDDIMLEQGENLENPIRCPVRLYEFYISKCPESIKNKNDIFYLIPEKSCIPDSPVWFTSQSYSLENMSKLFNRLQVVKEVQEAFLSNTPLNTN